jgi:DNA-binding transcriptional MocR family regulator
MFAYDVYDRVINIRSFSKIMFPGLRLAATVLPKVFLETFKDYKAWTADVTSSVISQGGLDIFIKSGLFTINKERMRALHTSRMAYLIQKLEENPVEGIRFSKPKDGFYLSLYAENGINYRRLSAVLVKDEIELVDIRGCFLPSFRGDQYIRLSTSKLDQAAIDRAIPIIMQRMGENILPAIHKRV